MDLITFTPRWFEQGDRPLDCAFPGRALAVSVPVASLVLRRSLSPRAPFVVSRPKYPTARRVRRLMASHRLLRAFAACTDGFNAHTTIRHKKAALTGGNNCVATQLQECVRDFLTGNCEICRLLDSFGA
jgi:hypothetical protein